MPTFGSTSLGSSFSTRMKCKVQINRRRRRVSGGNKNVKIIIFTLFQARIPFLAIRINWKIAGERVCVQLVMSSKGLNRSDLIRLC